MVLVIKQSYEKKKISSSSYRNRNILLFHALPYFYAILERHYAEAIFVLISECIINLDGKFFT